MLGLGVSNFTTKRKSHFRVLPNENSPQSGDTCELVVISKGFAYNDNYEYSMDEWKCKERPRSGEKYEFYNVMWISWLDGIAYRNGIGRVPKKIWEKEELGRVPAMEV